MDVWILFISDCGIKFVIYIVAKCNVKNDNETEALLNAISIERQCNIKYLEK